MSGNTEDRNRGDTAGVRIQVSDPRVSRLRDWVMGILASLAVLVGAWVANSINQLNVTVARVVDRSDALLTRIDRNDARDDRQDADLNTLNQHVYMIEGKTLRGIQESSRGR